MNDGDQTPLENLIAPFQTQIKLTLVSQSHAGPAAARNTGAARATGQFLVFTDDDCLPTADWLNILAAHFAVMPTVAIGGKTLNALPENVYSTTSQLLIDYLYTFYNAIATQARFCTSNNFALPKASFQKIDGFNTTFPLSAGEDREFCDRWLGQNYALIYVPEALVYHAHELTFSKFWRQQFNYGCGAFHFHQICSQRDRTHSRLESLRFYVNLLTYPLHQRVRPVVLVTVLFALSQAATLAGILSAKVKA